MVVLAFLLLIPGVPAGASHENPLNRWHHSEPPERFLAPPAGTDSGTPYNPWAGQWDSFTDTVARSPVAASPAGVTKRQCAFSTDYLSFAESLNPEDTGPKIHTHVDGQIAIECFDYLEGEWFLGDWYEGSIVFDAGVDGDGDRPTLWDHLDHGASCQQGWSDESDYGGPVVDKSEHPLRTSKGDMTLTLDDGTTASGWVKFQWGRRGLAAGQYFEIWGYVDWPDRPGEYFTATMGFWDYWDDLCSLAWDPWLKLEGRGVFWGEPEPGTSAPPAVPELVSPDPWECISQFTVRSTDPDSLTWRGEIRVVNVNTGDWETLFTDPTTSGNTASADWWLGSPGWDWDGWAWLARAVDDTGDSSPWTEPRPLCDGDGW